MSAPVDSEGRVAEIARGLTFVEQQFVGTGSVRMAWPFEVQARERLIARGLLKKRWFSYRWTALGLAVRAHLNDIHGEKQ